MSVAYNQVVCSLADPADKAADGEESEEAGEALHVQQQQQEAATERKFSFHQDSMKRYKKQASKSGERERKALVVDTVERDVV